MCYVHVCNFVMPFIHLGLCRDLNVTFVVVLCEYELYFAEFSKYMCKKSTERGHFIFKEALVAFLSFKLVSFFIRGLFVGLVSFANFASSVRVETL